MNKKKKVLVGFIGESRGGLSQYIINMYRNIDKKNIDMEFLAIGTNVFFKDDLERLGAKIHYITPKSKSIKKYKEDLKGILSNGYDTIYIHKSTLSNIDVFKYAKQVGVENIIIHSHSSRVEGNITTRILHNLNKKVLNKYVTKKLACSKQSGCFMYSDYDFEVINNGIDLNKFYYDEKLSNSVKCNLNLNNKIVVGHVGRFVDVKNHKYLIELFYEMKKNNSNLFLILCGDGPLRESIEEYAKVLGISEDIMFTGDVNNINEFINCMDLFILPSKFEGYPLVVVEAIAVGLPIFISSNITDEVMLCDLVNKIDINNEKLEENAKWILKKYLSYKKRECYNDLLKEKCYDIKGSLKRVENIIIKGE